MAWRTAPGFLAACTVDGDAATVGGSADLIWSVVGGRHVDLDDLADEVAHAVGVPCGQLRQDVVEAVDLLAGLGFLVVDR